ncbi:unnamed protein product [Rotaria socialis]|uniref:C2H2-type domain-containing protein n=1 Tax=Rotaria socialis TaxID=392032 RepID=A0A818X3W8_9BILA|nr:unnamed protein product [Rotaria socialis]
MQSYHSSTHKVVVPCPYCPETLTQVRSWKRHILKVHYSRIVQQHAENDITVIADNTDHSTVAEADVNLNVHVVNDENDSSNDENYSISNNRSPIPEYTNDLSHGSIQIFHKTEERLRLNVLRLLINLKSNNATEACIDVCSKDLINVLNEYKDLDTNIYFHNIKKAIETATCRNKFISSHIDVIRPKSIILGQSNAFSKKKQRHVLRIHKAQYIPFKESLINLLKKPEVYESLNCPSRANIMTDLSTGSFCDQHPVFKLPDSLKIILFYDDIGINNPLGTRTKSVGMFYWTLANLPRFVRSQDRCVFLLACIEKQHLKQYGFTIVLDDFFRTIEELQTHGIPVTINEKIHIFKGSLLLICGDILGLSQMHGFKCAFRLGRKPFFYCDVNQDTIRRINKGSECHLRKLEKYDKNCMAIDFANEREKARLQKKYGIISLSPFRKINNFDIFHQTGIDIMHVLLEGICQRELKLLLKHIQQQKFANLSSLTSMIRNFQYGCNEPSPSDKFNLSSEDNEVKFRASASEMLSLFKYMPFIFHQSHLTELISASVGWHSFLLLREIISISLASEIDITTIEKLEELVTRYLITFDNAYGYVQRIPKHHLLVHFGEQMHRFGPLRFTSCMIFEKKHSFFKRIKYRNFRNIAFTLADRHQHYIASLMYTCSNAATSSFLYSGHQIKKVKELDSSAAKQHYLLDMEKNLYETNQVTLFGITYVVGEAVLINDSVFPIDPVFGKILTIIVQDKIILLRLQLMQVIVFNQKLCVYEVRLLDSSVTKNVYELKHVWPVRLLKISKSLFTSLFPYGRSYLTSNE